MPPGVRACSLQPEAFCASSCVCPLQPSASSSEPLSKASRPLVEMTRFCPMALAKVTLRYAQLMSAPVSSWPLGGSAWCLSDRVGRSSLVRRLPENNGLMKFEGLPFAVVPSLFVLTAVRSFIHDPRRRLAQTSNWDATCRPSEHAVDVVVAMLEMSCPFVRLFVLWFRAAAPSARLARAAVGGRAVARICVHSRTT